MKKYERSSWDNTLLIVAENPHVSGAEIGRRQGWCDPTQRGRIQTLMRKGLIRRAYPGWVLTPQGRRELESLAAGAAEVAQRAAAHADRLAAACERLNVPGQ